MDLDHAQKHLRHVYNSPDYGNDDLAAAMKHYEAALAACTDPDAVERITRMDEGTLIMLPIDSGIATHRRLLALKRTPTFLRDFARYLLLYGPFWDDEAEDLLNEADEMESEPNDDTT